MALSGRNMAGGKICSFEPAKDIILFSHMLTGDPNYANVTQAVDFSTGLATTVHAQIGSWNSEWEIEPMPSSAFWNTVILCHLSRAVTISPQTWSENATHGHIATQ